MICYWACMYLMTPYLQDMTLHSKYISPDNVAQDHHTMYTRPCQWVSSRPGRCSLTPCSPYDSTYYLATCVLSIVVISESTESTPRLTYPAISRSSYLLSTPSGSSSQEWIKRENFFLFLLHRIFGWRWAWKVNVLVWLIFISTLSPWGMS